jgi:hypothetical protein
MVAVAMIVGLVVPTSAGAVVHHLRGSVVGDANGKVFMSVVVRNGKPKRVKNFRWKNLDGACFDVPDGEQSGQKRGSTRIEVNKFFRASGLFGGGNQFDFSGFVRNRGRRIANGNVQIFYGNGCEAPTAETSPRGGGKFTATKV